MHKIKDKRGFQFSFAWLFAIIVGALILILAIIAATRYVDLGQKEVTTKTAQEIANYLDPLKTSIESGSSVEVPLGVETRIKTNCNINGNFGNTIIEISENTGFGGKWTDFGGDIKTENSYLFSENLIETKNKKLYFFAFPFKMPFKVGDILIAYTDAYCFISPPTEIENTLNALGSENPNILLVDNINSCPENSKKVCFNTNCDISVYCVNGACTIGSVTKQGERIDFINNIPGENLESSLLYGAIFSSKENYECNVQRLAKRLEYLSDIYKQKAQFVSIRGCDTNLAVEMSNLQSSAANYPSTNLNEIASLAEFINDKNKELECHLY